MSFGSAELRPVPNHGTRTFDQRVGVGRRGLGETCKGRNADHGQHDRRGNAPGDEYARLALTTAEVVNERLHMSLRGRLRFERQARLKGLKVAEIVAAAGLGADCERKVLKKGAELLVVGHQGPQSSRERAGKCHPAGNAPRILRRLDIRKGAAVDCVPAHPGNRRRTIRFEVRAGQQLTQRLQTRLCSAGRGGTDHICTPWLLRRAAWPPGVTRPVFPPPTKKAR